MLPRVTKIFRLAIAVLLAALSLAAADSQESIIGYWQLIRSEKNDPNYHRPNGDVEMKFTSNGALIIKFRDPTAATNGTRMVVGKFTLVPPDRVTMSLEGQTEEHYRYLLKEGELRMEHLEQPITNTLKRLKEFSL
jgi:hypothetical protein